MTYHIPRIMLAAPASGSGKTTVTCGLLQALLDRNCSLAAFKCGPDYIDPMFHKYVLGIDGRNLDSFFLGEEEIRRQLTEAAVQKDMAVIEGVMGYFDGAAGTSTWASSYEIARITDTPVILVVDCKGASLSIVAVIQGFLQYGVTEDAGENAARHIPGNQIKGVLLNRMSAVMAERLKPEIERLGVSVVGWIPECAEMRLESRHLGLIRPDELDMLKTQIEGLAEQIRRTVDIDQICNIASLASDITMPETDDLKTVAGKLAGNRKIGESDLVPEISGTDLEEDHNLRIAVARDQAFCFYYQENFCLLESMGAELVMFSPMKDRELPPQINGMILGGGYPELYAAELSFNTSMLESIRTAMKSGMPTLAECGGFLYLHQELEGDDETSYTMAGVIDGTAFRTARLSRFGYITLEPNQTDCCLKTEIKGHEFHYWDSTSCGTDWTASKPLSTRSWTCVHSANYQITGFPHLYYPSNPDFLKRWLEGCRNYGINLKLGDEHHMSLEQLLTKISGLDETACAQAQYRWDHIAKPLHSLGLLESAIVKIAGIQKQSQIQIDKKALIIMCADNGIAGEGVTQTGQEVTAIVTENFTKGDTCVCIMAERAGVDVYPVDIGVSGSLDHCGTKHPLISRKIAPGTRNFLREPAMTAEETMQAIETGIDLVKTLKENGYQLIATGEMGIGNTTTSSAVASALTGLPPVTITGKGAGLSDEGLKKKICVIEEAITRYWPESDGENVIQKDPLDVLSKVGGLDIAGLTGVFLGGAIYRIPIMIDGFISSTAALVAASICPAAAAYMLASHVSAEPAGGLILERLGLQPMITAHLCLGEGTGAMAAIPLFDMAADIYCRMSTFQEIQIEDYKPL